MPHAFEGFSRAMYSNWFWHRPLQLIVDAGEGLPLALGSNAFTATVVAITHGHSDHVLGLPGLAGARRFGKGATSKPWTVVYPEGCHAIEVMRHAIAELWRGVEFPITWTALAPGARVALSGPRQLEAFTVTHAPPAPTVGYRVVEARRRLKPEFAELPQTEIEQRVRRNGRDALMESYEHVVFAHSGDAMPIDPQLVTGADLLVHDATFLDAAERRELIHATSVEALDVARQAEVGMLVLTHLSIRYRRDAAVARLREQVAASGFAGACVLLDESHIIDLVN
jgi:ribonuclease Z